MNLHFGDVGPEICVKQSSRRFNFMAALAEVLSSAFADFGGVLRIGQQCIGYLSIIYGTGTRVADLGREVMRRSPMTLPADFVD